MRYDRPDEDGLGRGGRGLAAAPFIGLAIGALGERFKDDSWPIRALFALGSLYLAVAAFFLIINMAFMASGPVLPLPMREHNTLALVVTWVVSLLMAFTFLGFFLLFWPLSFLTHSLFWACNPGGRTSVKLDL